MKEIWKDIPEYEGIYSVSINGNIKSLDRYVNGKNINIKQFIKGKNLIPKETKKGYLSIILCYNKKRKVFLIHQLVMITFKNHKPNGNTIVVNHINGNKKDNRIENLELVTNRDNCSKEICYINNKKEFSSKYTGVTFMKKENNYRGYIKINNKQINLGRFESEKKASEYYKIAKKNIDLYNNNDLNFKEIIHKIYLSMP